MKFPFVMLSWVCAIGYMTYSKAENHKTRLKDLVEVRGMRPNPLNGYGLVIGLAGTGDSKQSLATNKGIALLLSRLGVQSKAEEVTSRNVASVIVTAELPPFARNGDRIDVRVSAIGDSQSLEGGTLILTQLSAADDQVYAVVQGPISQGTGMAGAGGAGRSQAPKTIAIAKAATVEREFAVNLMHRGFVELSLRNADFTTASKITKAINEQFREFIAEADNAGLVRVRLPVAAQNSIEFPLVSFLSQLEQIKVDADQRAIVVINERTGTIISGGNVTLDPIAISHGNLQIIVKNQLNRVGEIKSTTTVSEMVTALNILGAGPKDLVSIFQALDAAKALRAELKIL